MQFEKLGLACFGPLDLNPASATYGNITATPKRSWSGTPIMARLQDSLNCRVSIDTDVNGAALAEATLGANKDTKSLVYLTIGTGFGGGFTETSRVKIALVAIFDESVLKTFLYCHPL